MERDFDPSALAFPLHRAQRFEGAARSSLHRLKAALPALPPGRAGLRIQGNEALRSFLAPDGAIGSIAAAVLGAASRPVRALLFDKTAETNWSLGWHQDRTICVRRRIEVEGFGPWTTKAGLQHVAPPFELLTRMVTLRVHLDDAPFNNAPLLIAPGSHTQGPVPIEAIEEMVRRCGTCACLAKAGDIWLYATPILHASGAAKTPKHRRVLQCDFAAEDLPGDLEWLGV